uniref:Uncharacterized protein n=1 Tax=Arundo donax TaxID=35708 RepID=A0A0A9QEY0_ARUDO
MGKALPWKKIWELPCPHKVKIFVWRLAHNSLPIKRNLQSKGLDLDTRCPVCFRFDEDGGHILFKCKYAKRIWRELLLDEHRTVMVGFQSSKEVISYILNCT